MSLQIETRINSRYKTLDIKSFKYPHFEEEVVFPSVSHGVLLPSGPGFPFRLERPCMSFKVYRAIAEKGLKNLADRVVSSRFRSQITPDNVWAGVLRYAAPTAPRVKDPVYLECLQELRNEMNCKLVPITIDEVSDHIPQSTSPGLPFIRSHPGFKKGDVLSSHLKNFKNYWTRVGEGKKTTPLPDCAAFARSHLGKIGVNKVRPVWAYPLEVIVEEARFSVPILEALKKQKIGKNFAYGMELLKGGMTWLNHKLKRTRAQDPGSKFIMVDYSSFDSSVPAWLIRDVFAIIAEMFDFDQHDARRFKHMVDYFINTPIQNMDGRRFQKFHGVPSGSMFTNIIDTMVNYVVTRYALLKTTTFQPLFFNCFGDDSVASMPSHALINMSCISKAAAVFGLKVNEEKSYWTNLINNVHYLGYYNLNGDPVKPTEELIASMLFPQYLKDDWAYCIARSLGCLLASCGNSSDVFFAAQSVYWKAHRESSVNVEQGLDLIRNNPRMYRHLSQMGAGEWNLSPEFFFRRDYSFPRLDCTKLLMSI